MKWIKTAALTSLLVSIFAAVTISWLTAEEPEVQVLGVSFEYGRQRPFSFYYPYPYQYYYPRRHYDERAPSCYWRYVNGTYVYYCK